MLIGIRGMGRAYGPSSAVHHRKRLFFMLRRHWRDETSMLLAAGSLLALVYILLSPSNGSIEICFPASILSFLYFMKKVL